MAGSAPSTFAKFVSPYGPEFEAAMKVLKDKGKPQARMQTWRCPEDGGFYVFTGKPGCVTCKYFEIRVEHDS